MAASARPQRLVDFAATSAAIADGLTTRAGWIDDDWQAYAGLNGVDWRFDFADLPEALRAWARTLRAVGAFVGAVGAAFLEADAADGRDGGDVHRLGEGRLRDLMPRDLRLALDERTAAADDLVDWGEPDDPPGWYDALQFTATAVSHVGEGIDALEIAYVVGTGPARSWSPQAPALLGRFASASSFAAFADVFSIGSSLLSGTTAGVAQVRADGASLNYTDDEIRDRALTSGGIAGGGALVTSVAAGSAASTMCGPGAPVCAGAVIITVGFGGSLATDWVTDRLVGSPRPGEHDPDVVADHVDSVAPGTLLRDIPDWTLNEVIGPIEEAGTQAGAADFAARHPYLDTAALHRDPGLAERYDLPPDWVDDRLADHTLLDLVEAALPSAGAAP